jgi:anti-anti-sigma factor
MLRELDLASTGLLRDQVLARLARLPIGTRATLDLRRTTYLASAGVGMLLEALARAGEAGLELRVRTEQGTPPARILALAGLGEQSGGGAARRSP